VAVEEGIEEAVEGATVVAPRARRRHPPVDAEDVVDGVARAAVLAEEALDRGTAISISSAFSFSTLDARARAH
jgi:hypothetical protein